MKICTKNQHRPISFNFYCCTVHYGICMLFIHQQLHFLLSVCTTNSTHAVSRHAATSPQKIQRNNYTESFNRSVTLARLFTAPWGWSKTETCRSDNYVYFNINLNFSEFSKIVQLLVSEQRMTNICFTMTLQILKTRL